MKLVNFLPSFAIRSMFGVFILSDPKQDKSPYSWSSVKIRMKFGFFPKQKVPMTKLQAMIVKFNFILKYSVREMYFSKLINLNLDFILFAALVLY